MDKAETSKENGKLGGRPKGSKSKATLEKEAVLRVFREKVLRSASVLYNSQLHRATGQTFLYKIPKVPIIDSKGKVTGYKNGKPKLITEQWEIEDYLNGIVDEGNMEDEKDPNATYYFITAKEADNKSIDSMLDRTFGKAPQAIDLDVTTGGEKLPILVKFLNVDENNRDTK